MADDGDEGASANNGDAQPPNETTGTPDHPRKSHRVRNGVLIGILVLVLGLGTTVGLAYAQLNGRLGHVNTTPMLGDDRPTNSASESNVRSPGDPFAGQAVNILVLGSDSRAGANSEQADDGVDGERSDTTFIAHVSADRTRIDVVSIPRDTLITIPDCTYPDGSRVPESGDRNQKFNSAFAYGSMGAKATVASGVACTIKAVEAMSNVRIDGFVLVDFAGFTNIVNTIGGVDIFLPCAIVAPKADNLNLPEGVNHLDGTTATSYARARTGQGLGDGSDLMRIQRQQALFEAIATKVLGMNYMTDIKTLYNFVGSVADSVTTDLGSITRIAGFAYSLRDMSGKSLTFTTIPVGGAPDGINVLLQPSRDQPYWDALIFDTPLKEALPQSSTPTPTPTPTSTSGLTAPPGMISAPPNQCKG